MLEVTVKDCENKYAAGNQKGEGYVVTWTRNTSIFVVIELEAVLADLGFKDTTSAKRVDFVAKRTD